MKKSIALMFVLVLILAFFAGCSGKSEEKTAEGVLSGCYILSDMAPYDMELLDAEQLAELEAEKLLMNYAFQFYPDGSYQMMYGSKETADRTYFDWTVTESGDYHAAENGAIWLDGFTKIAKYELNAEGVLVLYSDGMVLTFKESEKTFYDLKEESMAAKADVDSSSSENGEMTEFPVQSEE